MDMDASTIFIIAFMAAIAIVLVCWCCRGEGYARVHGPSTALAPYGAEHMQQPDLTMVSDLAPRDVEPTLAEPMADHAPEDDPATDITPFEGAELQELL